MLESARIAHLYLASRSLEWRWADGSGTIVWRDGTTIAFREEVELVLARLSPAGLPDFEAVVLLLALSREGSRRRLLERCDVPLLRELLEKAGALLPVLEEGPIARAVLAEMVFEKGQRRSSPEAAALVLQGIRGGLLAEDLQIGVDAGDTRDPPIFDHVRTLHRSLTGIDGERLKLRMRTGLDHLLVPAPIDLPEVLGPRAMIARLLDDPELSGLARLARDLMAVAHIPRSVSERDEMPLGGYSDISNRGSIDRLLPSELAHDEATLAVRVALNEALFLRRESPPRSPPRTRLLLLDAGIRLWGVPRVFSTAAALAFAATVDQSGKVSVVRPRGESLVDVDLRTREGIIAHLEALETPAHPGEALPALLEKIAEEDGPMDAVLVTHEDVVRDNEFQRALAVFGAQPIHIAEVSRAGGFRLLLRSRTGRRILREGRIDLDAVLSPAARPAPSPRLLDDGWHPDLPSLLALKRLPFLLPCHRVKLIVAASEESGVVGVTHDGRLVHWTGPDLAARQIADSIPPGTLHWCRLDADGRVLLLIGPEGARPAVLFTAEVRAGETRSVLLKANPRGLRGACGHRNTVFLVYRDRVEGFDSHTGEKTCALAISRDRLVWTHGRFFQEAGTGGFHALAYDGTAARLEPIRNDPARQRWTGIACFDRQGHDGPWLVMKQGKVMSSVTHEEIEIPIPDPLHLVGVSADGRFIGYMTPGGKEEIFDLEKRRSWDCSAHLELADPHLARLAATPRTIRNRFDTFGLDGHGRVHLLSRDSSLLLGLSGAGEDFEWSAVPPPKGLFLTKHFRYQHFERVHGLPGRRYSLREARFEDGSRAFLDSRGILHLKSSDRSIPEVAIVISEGHTAAWSSDGKICGSTIFTGDERRVGASRIHEHIRRFAERAR